MNKAQHPTSGIAKHYTSSEIPHQTISTSRCVIWWYLTENVVWCEMWYGVLCQKCGLMWKLLSCGGEMWNVYHIAPHHIIPPHFTLHHSTSNTISDIIPNHTTFHVWPFLTISHFISHQHLYSILQYYISNCTVSATLCSTPHVALHPISHYIPHKATFHVLHGTLQITSYIGHIMHCTTTSHIAPHFQDNVAPNFTCRSISCINASFHHIWPWSHPIPHPTTMFYITFHISTPPYSTSHHLPHRLCDIGGGCGRYSQRLSFGCDNDDGCSRYSQRSSLGSDNGDGCGRYRECQQYWPWP